MSKNDIVNRLPIVFEKVEQYDNRFMKCKIYILNVGKNYNGSIFTKEAIEKAIPSIYNTPILGFIEQDRFGVKDFRGHEVELVVKNGELSSHYLGSAYGVIPESCNPKFELRENEFGGVEEYLTVECLMWEKFDDAIDIMSRDSVKSQSMELHDEYSGKWNDEGYFVFEDFKFFGAAILGEGVEPAIPKSTIEQMFSNNNGSIQSYFNNKHCEYSHILEKYFSPKEVENEMSLVDVIASKYSLSVEQLEERGININDYSLENMTDLESKIEDQFGSATTPTLETERLSSDDNKGSTEEEINQEQTSIVIEQDKFSLNFELSHEDIRSKLYKGLDEYIRSVTENDGWNYIVSVSESHFIVEDSAGQKFFKVEYNKGDEVITFGDVKEVFGMFLATEEKDALEMMRSTLDLYEKENAELKDFQSSVLKLQHESAAESVLAQFDKLSLEELSEIREKIHEYTIPQIESKCFELVGRKTTKYFSTSKATPYSMKISVTPDIETTQSGYAHLFKKHGLSQ